MTYKERKEKEKHLLYLIKQNRLRCLDKTAEDFNCCKTVHCKNFARANSVDYIVQSWRLGYLSIYCKVCGSSPPWIDNELVD